MMRDHSIMTHLMTHRRIYIRDSEVNTNLDTNYATVQTTIWNSSSGRYRFLSLADKISTVLPMFAHLLCLACISIMSLALVK